MHHADPAALVPIAQAVEPAPLLRATGLSRRFAGADRPAVHDLSLDLAAGEFLALLGPSGCGKTTTLRMIGGFETPDAGRLHLGGRDITHLPPERRGIGFVFQDYALFPHLDVLDNVRFGLRGMARALARARAREMLAMVGLSDVAGRRPHELSGGQQQRVALARTLAVEPPVVLLDEPFSNLDATLRVETRQEVRALLRQTGSAAILVTHDQEEALAIADRVAVMEGGRLRQIGTPDEVHRHPATAFVARFIGRANLLPAQAGGLSAETPFGRLPLSRPAKGALQVSVRPEQIVLERDAAAPDAVVAHEFRGHDQLYWVQSGERRLLVIAGPGTPIEVGAKVRMQVRDCVVPLP